MHSIKKHILNIFRSVKILYTASRKFFITKVIITVISAVLPLAPLYLWRGLLNVLVVYMSDAKGQILSAIILFTILYCLIQIIQSVMSSISKVVSYKYNDEVSYYLDNMLIDKISHIDLVYFDSSELKNKLNYTAQVMQSSTLGVIDYMLSILEQLVWLIFASVIVSRLNIILVIIIIMLTVLAFLGERFLQNQERIFKLNNTKTERRLRYYQGLFFGNTLQDVKLFNLKGYFSRLYKSQWDSLHKARINMNIKACFISCVSPPPRPCIEFRNVSFKYPNAENWVLIGCSFIIEPGETVGLVGLNGSGKSTIVKLLCRFYDPTEGQILIDGIDAREYDIVKLRALYSTMFQDFCKYSFTLRESIAISDLTRINDENALIDACNKSNVTDFIKDWEKGLDEDLTRQFTYTGKELSVGQWQRIALGRAFFRNAHIALLDEPSASLDPIAEHDIFTMFSQLSDKKSALLITHRLSSITLADKILVLENGHIIEQGSHKELLKKKGRYAYLFNLQASKYV